MLTKNVTENTCTVNQRRSIRRERAYVQKIGWFPRAILYSDLAQSCRNVIMSAYNVFTSAKGDRSKCDFIRKAYLSHSLMFSQFDTQL